VAVEKCLIKMSSGSQYTPSPTSSKEPCLAPAASAHGGDARSGRVRGFHAPPTSWRRDHLLVLCSSPRSQLHPR